MKKLITLTLLLSGLQAFAQPQSLINKKDTMIFLDPQSNVNVFSVNGLMGAMDQNRKVIVPAQYKRLNTSVYVDRDFKYRFFETEEGKGVMDENFNVLIEPGIYEEFKVSHDGYFTVEKDKKHAFVNTKGELISAWYDDAEYYWNGMARVKSDGKWGFLAFKGKEVVAPTYKASMRCDESDMAAVSTDGKKWGFINLQGKEVIPQIYAKVDQFRQDLAAVSVDGKKWIYINTDGETVIDSDYESTKGFHFDLAAVENDGKWGFINRSGDVVIPFDYKDAKSFDSKHIAAVKKGNRYILINKQNKQVIPGEFFDVRYSHFNPGHYRVKTSRFSRWREI